MRRNCTPGGLLSLLPSRRGEAHAEATGSRTEGGTARFEAFCAQTFHHMDSLYSDALCLTGNPEDAADLVEAAYVRAFECYEPFRRRRVRERLRTRSTLAWLYGTMHAAFCDGILAQARRVETPNGDCP